MDNIIYESVCEGLTLRHTEHPGQKLYISVRNNKSVTLQTEKKKKETFSKLSTAYKNSVLQLPKVPINTSYKLLQATESHSWINAWIPNALVKPERTHPIPSRLPSIGVNLVKD